MSISVLNRAGPGVIFRRVAAKISVTGLEVPGAGMRAGQALMVAYSVARLMPYSSANAVLLSPAAARVRSVAA
jgi:hypothetical protein